MNSKLLIDGLVRQTMVLIAQVATLAGARTPLTHVANQVFMDLTRELEEQGLGRKVVADMFGLALRSYQQKVDRITESASSVGVTLWAAIDGYVAERKTVTRGELHQHFAADNPVSVAGILHDMVESGLVYKTGRGDATVYRVTDADELRTALEVDPREVAVAHVWATIYRQGPLSLAELLEVLPLSGPTLEAALEALLADGRVERAEVDGVTKYGSRRMLLPLGETAGWEAGVLDHHRTMVAAICAKLRNGNTRAVPSDQLGGSTFSFDVWPGHPHELRVLGLLAEQRRVMAALWDEVSRHNDGGKPRDYTRVSFYCGQLVTAEPGGPTDDAGKEAT